ncbi:MAG: hypothetical protein M3436_10940 [Pseudomonadota bacterium]|nr:hypothetical protein [Pseudomonadota bacterium]
MSPVRGTLKIIAAIEHPTVIAKILTHLGLSARAPRAVRILALFGRASRTCSHNEMAPLWPL